MTELDKANLKKYFNGKCPFTDKQCESWDCINCEVEKAEREYMESEVD